MTDRQKCKDYFERLSELLDGKIGEGLELKIKEHLKTCPKCRVCWATFQKSVELHKLLPPQPLSPEFIRKLKLFLRETEKR